MKRLGFVILVSIGLIGVLFTAYQTFSQHNRNIYSVAELDSMLAHSGQRWAGAEILLHATVLFCHKGFCWSDPIDLSKLAFIISDTGGKTAPDASVALRVMIVNSPQEKFPKLLRSLPVIGHYLPVFGMSHPFLAEMGDSNERTGLFRVKVLAHPVCSRWSRTTCYRVELFDSIP